MTFFIVTGIVVLLLAIIFYCIDRPSGPGDGYGD